MSTESRGVVVGMRGVVSAGDSLAASVGLNVLQTGGNAIDATLAASAVQCVVELPWCSLGGDAFMLVYTPEGGVVAFNGSGAAPLGLTADRIDGPRAPRYGPLSVAAPGLVATWQAVASRYATRPLSALLEPAVAYAADGFPVYPRFERALVKVRDADSTLGAFVRGNGARTGEVFRQPALARALESVAQDGLGGWVGESLVKHPGVALTRADLEALRVEPLSPVAAKYRGLDVYNHPPVSLGCVLLQELRILDGFSLDGVEAGSPELIDLLVRCKQAAFTDAAELGDPAFVDNRLEWLLSDERAAHWQDVIRERVPSQKPVGVGGGADTTSCVVADQFGNMVCLIQSLFNEWGSREFVESSGILLNDRLANLSLDASRPNGLRGGRRPIHTLNTYMAFADGRCLLAGATPGGRGQVQTNLQVIVNAVDYGMDVQAAIEAPRWINGLPYRGDHDPTLYLEPEFPPEVATSLRALGHPVEVGVTAGEQADPFGNCTVIARSPSGTLQAAADTRRDAAAVGY